MRLPNFVTWFLLDLVAIGSSSPITIKNSATASEVSSRDEPPTDKYFGPHVRSCQLNHDEANWCSFAIGALEKSPSTFDIRIFDNVCNEIGQNYATPAADLYSRSGYSLSSQLPEYIVAHVSKLTGTSLIADFWYNGHHYLPSQDTKAIKDVVSAFGIAVDPVTGENFVWNKEEFICH